MISKRQFFALFALMFISGINCNESKRGFLSSLFGGSESTATLAQNRDKCLSSYSLKDSPQSPNSILNSYFSLTAEIENPSSIRVNDSFTITATVTNKKGVCLPISIEFLTTADLIVDDLQSTAFKTCICNTASMPFRMRAVESNLDKPYMIDLRILTSSDATECENFNGEYPKGMEVFRTLKTLFVQNAEPVDGVYEFGSQYYAGKSVYFKNEVDPKIYSWNSVEEKPTSRFWEIKYFNRTLNGRALYTIRNIETKLYLTASSKMYDANRRTILGINLDTDSVPTCSFLWRIVPLKDNSYYIVSFTGEFLYTAASSGKQGLTVTWAASNDGAWNGSEEQKRRWILNASNIQNKMSF